MTDNEKQAISDFIDKSQMSQSEIVELYLQKFIMRCNKRNDIGQRYISYSGGNDSELLRYLLNDYFKLNIPVINVNTRMEHSSIKARVEKYADEILTSELKPFDIKEKYGIPCFTKQQDEYIDRYQKGCRTEYLMERINPTTNTKYHLNKTARELLLSGKLHRVSRYCCIKTKEEPLAKFGKKHGLKPIIGITGGDSMLRRGKYKSCINQKGQWTPMFDFPSEVVNMMIDYFQIEVPEIYDHTDTTGCFGCPYGARCGRKKERTRYELSLISEAQRKFATEYFKESYQVLGVFGED